MKRQHIKRLNIQSGIRTIARKIIARHDQEFSRGVRNRVAVVLMPNGQVVAQAPHKLGYALRLGSLCGVYGKEATPRLVAGDLVAAIRAMH